MLSFELILAVATFAFVTSATPGPNNIMLTASGVNFGYRRTLPHMLGIICGMATMNIAVGLGLGAVFTQFPLVQQILRVVGSAYLLWLAWQLLTFSSLGKTKEGGKPFTFMQAAAFQYVNPKAWVMVISANASFALLGEGYWLSVGLIVMAYMLIGLPSISIWAGFGQYIRRFLGKPRILKVFNLGMSVLTAACVVFIWLD